MGKKNEDTSGQLHFDDFGSDGFEATTQVMSNRSRFEALDPGQRARLAEHLVTLDVRKFVGKDDEEVKMAEDNFQDILGQMLSQIESPNRAVGCYFCHSVIADDEEAVQLHMSWRGDGKQLYSEATEEIAHGRCVKRVREGGDPDTKPMF